MGLYINGILKKNKVIIMNEIRINIAKDFSETPGVRYISQGKYTGEGFRKKKLEPLFQDKNDNRKIIIELDGTFGYPTSFSEEAFGGLARIYGEKISKKET